MAENAGRRWFALKKALGVFGDSDEEEEFRRLEAAGAAAFLESNDNAQRAMHWHWSELRRKRADTLFDQVRSGKLDMQALDTRTPFDGHRRVAPDLLAQLKYDPSRKTLYGYGIELIELRFAEALESGHEALAHSDAARLRKRLATWIEDTATTERAESWKKEDFLKQACEEVSERIKPNLFRQVWDTANVPESFRRKGRRPRT